jgi:hypothetical protein
MAGIAPRLKPEARHLHFDEVDLNARRTGHRNVAEELARFQLNYVFGVEFRLSQGSRAPQRRTGVLSPYRSVRLYSTLVNQSDFWQPRWYFPTGRHFSAD